MSSTRYTHPRPAANSISEIILEALQTIEQGTRVQLTSAQARFPSDKVQRSASVSLWYRQSPSK